MWRGSERPTVRKESGWRSERGREGEREGEGVTNGEKEASEAERSIRCSTKTRGNTHWEDKKDDCKTFT